MKILILTTKRPWVERAWWWLKFFFKVWVGIMVFLILRAFNWPGGTP